MHIDVARSLMLSHANAAARCAGSPGTVEVEGASEAVTSMLQLMRDARASPLMTLMVAFPQRLAAVPFDGAAVTNSPVLEWVARDSSKPGAAVVHDSEDPHAPEPMYMPACRNRLTTMFRQTVTMTHPRKSLLLESP